MKKVKVKITGWDWDSCIDEMTQKIDELFESNIRDKNDGVIEFEVSEEDIDKDGFPFIRDSVIEETLFEDEIDYPFTIDSVLSYDYELVEEEKVQ